MNKITFKERLTQKRPILLDGATGTELNQRGVHTGLPLWSAWALIDAPLILSQVHYDYLKAGAEVLTANTFRTHQRNLALAGLGKQARELTQKAVSIAQQVIEVFQEDGGHTAWVAGSVAPLEDCYRADLVPPQAECEREHALHIKHLAEAGVDLILIETMNSIREARAALQAAVTTGLPCVLSFVLRTDGRLFSGESLSSAVKALEAYAPDMFGINCTPSTMITDSLAKLKDLTDRPLAVYGNIGHTDDIVGWENTEDLSPEAYCQLAENWKNMNAKLIGGCCGTSPTYISTINAWLNAQGTPG